MVWHAISRAIINVRMSSRKKKRSCPFSSAKGRPKKVKNTFHTEWVAKLAESDKGSFNTKKNCWMNSIAITKLASKPKWAQVTVKYNCNKLSKQRKIDEEKWTKLKGRSIVSACRFSQGDVNIMENMLSRNGLGSSWIIQCQNVL